MVAVGVGVGTWVGVGHDVALPLGELLAVGTGVEVPYQPAENQYLFVGDGVGLWFGDGQTGGGVTRVGVGHGVGLAVGESLAVGSGVGGPYQSAENQYLFVGDGVGLWVGDGQTGGVVTPVGVGHGVGLAVGESLAVGVGVGDPYQSIEDQYLSVADGVGFWVGDGQTGGGVTPVGVGP
jgi:hypothetical protein